MAAHSSAAPDRISTLVAGTMSGLLTSILVHPLDLIRTRMQVHRGPGSAYRGVLDAFMTINRNEGWRGLYQGFTPSLLGSALSWGLFMWFYNMAKSRNSSYGWFEAGSAGNHLFSAAEAGFSTAIITNPIWLVKTRLELQRANARPAANFVPYKGITDCLIRVAKEEGVVALYHGLLPSLMLCSHGAIQFTVYEALKTSESLRAATSSVVGVSVDPTNSLYMFALAGLSKMTAATATFPLMTVRSRMQQRPSERDAPSATMGQTTMAILRNEGIRGFFKGLTPCLLRVTPHSAIMLLMYEKILTACTEFRASS